MMRILALDMAKKTGWAFNRPDGTVVSGAFAFEQGCPKGGETIAHPYMLANAERQLSELMLEAQPDVVMIEAGFQRGKGDKILQRLIGIGMLVAQRGNAAVLSTNAKAWRKALYGTGGLTTEEAKARAVERTGVTDPDEAEARCILEYTLRFAVPRDPQPQRRVA